MGLYSFRRADDTSCYANFIGGKDRVKILIPEEFVPHYGASFLKGDLDGYGRVTVKKDGKPVKIDLYGLLAFFNNDGTYENTDDGWADTYNGNNRDRGIRIGCYPVDHAKCKYPLKLVSPSYTGTYEGLDYFSTYDGQQGVRHETLEDLTLNTGNGQYNVGNGDLYITIAEHREKYCKVRKSYERT